MKIIECSRRGYILASYRSRSPQPIRSNSRPISCHSLGDIALSKTFASKIVYIFIPLALAVFSWGLQYKLSLYDPPQSISHQMVEAKLLSPEERTAVADNTLVWRAKSSSEGRAAFFSGIFFLSGIFLFSLLALNPAVRSRNRNGWRPRGRGAYAAGSLNAFFFRPSTSPGACCVLLKAQRREQFWQSTRSKERPRRPPCQSEFRAATLPSQKCITGSNLAGRGKTSEWTAEHRDLACLITGSHIC